MSCIIFGGSLQQQQKHNDPVCSFYKYQKWSCRVNKYTSVSLIGVAEVVQLLCEGEDQ